MSDRAIYNLKSAVLFSVSAIVLILFGQNCSGGFESLGEYTSFSSLSQGASQARFKAARAVITNNCSSCHNGGSAPTLNFSSEGAFVAAGLVTPGNLAASKIIHRLKNYPEKNGLQNMPTNGTLSSADYNVLTNWVMMIGKSDGPFTCDPNEIPNTLDAKRLSKKQIYNSLHGLFARAIGYQDAVSLISTAAVWTRIPNDSALPFTNSDINFSTTHAEAMIDVGDVLAREMVKPANYARFVDTFINYDKGACSYSDPANLNDVCRQTLIKNFLLRAWGRPAEIDAANLNNELAAFLNDFNSVSTTAGVENMIFRALLAPEFIFHLQIDVKPAGSFHQLSSHMIARRLSFSFTQSLPDETLLNFGSQDLFDEAKFMQALEYASSQMDASVESFTREWMKLDKLPTYNNQNHPKFALVSQGLVIDDSLRKAMGDEVVELVTYIAKNARPARELLTTDIAFARNPSLMKIYNQSLPAPASFNEATALRLPAGERSGLLTRAAMLFSGGHTENPVLRGVHIRDQMLCLPVAPPPPSVANQITTPLPDVNLTTRERYHNKTSGTSCIGCHSQINPVGFAFSKYNAFGGLQSSEAIYDAQTPANLVKYLSVDSSVDLTVALGVNQKVNDAVEFSSVIADSPIFNSCLTRTYQTYASGLPGLPTETNSCSMDRMFKTLDNNGTLKDFFKSSVLDSRFKYRKINN